MVSDFFFHCHKLLLNSTNSGSIYQEYLISIISLLWIQCGGDQKPSFNWEENNGVGWKGGVKSSRKQVCTTEVWMTTITNIRDSEGPRPRSHIHKATYVATRLLPGLAGGDFIFQGIGMVGYTLCMLLCTSCTVHRFFFLPAGWRSYSWTLYR